MTTELTKIQKAKIRLQTSFPFYATIILRSPLKFTPCGTAATDGVNIFLDPTFIDLLDVEEQMFVLAHEAMHIVLKHALRRGTRHAGRWNIACDFAINWMLRKAKLRVLADALCDKRFDGMSAEQIYDLREKERAERKKKGQGQGQPQPQPCRGRPGEGTPDYGQDMPTMEDLIEPLGKIHDPDALRELEAKINDKIASAVTNARLQGKLPQDIERLVEGVFKPPLPWFDILRNYMKFIVSMTESWAHRSRRFQDKYLPSRHNEAMGELVIIGDTSGSMPKGVFPQVAAEINCIKADLNPERIRVIWADAKECNREEVFEPHDEIELHPKGGGGTDMRKPLKYVERFDPIVVILITDCETPWPDSVPYPLIVVATNNVSSPIGDVVRLPS